MSQTNRQKYDKYVDKPNSFSSPDPELSEHSYGIVVYEDDFDGSGILTVAPTGQTYYYDNNEIGYQINGMLSCPLHGTTPKPVVVVGDCAGTITVSFTVPNYPDEDFSTNFLWTLKEDGWSTNNLMGWVF